MRSFLLPILLALAGQVVTAAERPFPQPTAYAPGTLRPSLPPAKLDAAVAAAYDAWKARYLHPGCEAGQAYIAYNLEGHAEPKDALSCSEGHGYGMLLSVFFAGHDPTAQTNFDALFRFFRAHPSKQHPGLMAWQQMQGCRSRPGDDDSASDGDLDIAFALLLADAQWGSTGAIPYRTEALKTLAAIQAAEINPTTATVKLGDWATEGASLNDLRLSDFMPAHLRAFTRATGAPLWDRVLNRGYECLHWLQTQHAPETGLVPDFARGAEAGHPTPAPPKFLESKHDGHYHYNACRVPWRLGVDWLLTGEPRAHEALTKLNAFILRTTDGHPEAIRAGYHLRTGKPLDKDDTSLAFTAPFAVAAMAGEDQPWLDALVQKLLEPPSEDDGYYGRTISLLCLVAVSGHWWSP